jgi:glyoxylase-like metal-dependent hydrolase (beta-lactamase superfamily II)
MAAVDQIADNIYAIDPGLNVMFCLSYLVLGKKSALIDPGSTSQTTIVLDMMKEDLGIELASISYIIPTHLHLDHAGGAGYAARQMPNAKVVVPRRYHKQLPNPSALIKAFKATFGENFADTFGEVLPVPENQIESVDDGDSINLGNRNLEIILTRGHANHHICLIDSVTNGLFCGDTLGMYFPQVDGIVVVCPEGFDLQLQLQSIERLAQYDIRLLYFAHEGTGRNPSELMQRTAQQLKDCQQVVRESLMNGDDPAQTEIRLDSYFRSHVSSKLNYQKMYLSLTSGGYRKYIQKSSETLALKGEI